MPGVRGCERDGGVGKGKGKRHSCRKMLGPSEFYMEWSKGGGKSRVQNTRVRLRDVGWKGNAKLGVTAWSCGRTAIIVRGRGVRLAEWLARRKKNNGWG